MSDQWEAIRDLDDKENWFERTAVLSKDDHIQLLQCAKDILDSVVDNLPIASDKGQANDFEEFTDEDFQYSAAQFDVDYLERISTEKSEPSELTRQSLYVKFDPLVGRDSPKVNKIIQPITSGDLLMLNTPPPHGMKSCLTSNKPSASNKKHVQIGGTETLTESPLIPTDTSLTHPSQKTASGKTVSLLDSSPSSLPTSEPQQEFFTDYHEAPVPSQVPATPPTETLIKVLKYSEEDFAKKKEKAISEAQEKVKKEKEEERDGLRREIAALKRDAKKLQQKDNSLKMAVSTHQTVVAKLEADIQQFRERITAHEERENDVLEHHENCLRDMGSVKERSTVLTEDTNLLENIFEETHKSYLVLKNTHKNLVQQTELLERRKAQLKKWNNDSAALVRKLREDIKDQAQEIETKLEQSRKELEAKKSLEKAKQDQLHVQIESLQKDIQQLEQEKQQLSSMCEELMKAM